MLNHSCFPQGGVWLEPQTVITQPHELIVQLNLATLQACGTCISNCFIAERKVAQEWEWLSQWCCDEVERWKWRRKAFILASALDARLRCLRRKKALKWPPLAHFVPQPCALPVFGEKTAVKQEIWCWRTLPHAAELFQAHSNTGPSWCTPFIWTSWPKSRPLQRCGSL